MTAMRSWADDEQDRLNEIHGDYWQCWYVARTPRLGYTWHARPKGTPAATLQADSPGELEQAIKAAQAPSAS
jgi:hypothetical protein